MMNLLKEGIASGRVEKTELMRKLTIGGRTKAYPVYRVPLDMLYYNNQNDRIATWIEEYRSEHEGQEIDRSDIGRYNEWIERFIVSSNPEKIEQTKNNIALVDQREAGITLSDGRIVDGNRRFTCLRQLHRENANKFGAFETVILEEEMQNNAKQIKMLELMVQHGEEARVDYDPIDRLAGLYNDIRRNELLTVKEYAQSVNRSEGEVKKDLAVAELMEEYLETLSMPYQFHVARKWKLDGPLREIYRVLAKETDEMRREEMKQAAFAHMALLKSGDTSRQMRKIMNIMRDKREGRSFIEKGIHLAEKLADKIDDAVDAVEPAYGQPANTPQIAAHVTRMLEDIREDSEMVKEARNQADVADNRIRATASREQAASILEKALDSIEAIDRRIFPKLTPAQRKTIREDAAALIDLLEEIRRDADV